MHVGLLASDLCWRMVSVALYDPLLVVGALEVEEGLLWIGVEC
jgi:hypothetical protein